ncbi:MAG: diguanylate cyclase domain-containing protein, partial [Cyanobacteriota bacterium]
MSSAPWSLHLLSEVLAAFTVEKPTALRDVISRVAEAVDAEVAAILGPEQVLLSLGVTEEEERLLLQSAASRPALLQLAAGQLHTHWAPLHNNELLVVGRIRENYTLEERALLRAMGRSIKLSTQVLEAVEAEKSAKEEALREATHDYLTGLPNRRLVMQRLAEMLRSPQDPEVHRPAVLFIDLDRFKQINDAHGHSTGDQYLLSVSRILRELVSTCDLVGRLAGDEFIVITSSPGSAGVENLAARILGAIDRPLQVGSRHLQYSASIGLAVADPHDSPETLIDNADLAMYRAKELGRGRYACFDRSLRERAQNRADTERELRLALERGEIVA